MGKSSPDAPNVVGASKEQGEQARQLNYEQTRANRPNQANPWGTTQWTSTPVWNPITGAYEMQYTQVESLNPAMQSSLDSQQAVTAGRSTLAEGAMARAWEDFQNPMDFDQYGDPIQFNPEAGPQDFTYQGFDYDLGGGRQRAEDAAYARATQRLDPQFEERERSLDQDLRNRGLRAGDQAYDAAMSNLAQERADAYERARLGSVSEGRTEAAQAFDQARTLQGTQYGQAQTAAQLNAQLQGQRFGQGVQSNQIANALRQQQVQEDLFKRGFNLEEVERLLEGQAIEGGPPTTGGQTQTGQTARSGGNDTIVGKYLGGG